MGVQDLHEFYAFLFDSFADAVFVYEIDENDLPGRFIEVNDAACRMLGRSKSELLLMSVHDLAAPGSAAASAAYLTRLIENHELCIELMHISKSGERVPVEIHARLLTLRGKRLVVSVNRDIRSRKDMEWMVEQSYQEYRSLFQGNSDGVFCLDRTGRLLEVNQAGASLLGCDSEQLIDKLFIDYVVQEDTLKYMEHFQAILSGKKMTVELAARLFGGKATNISMSGMPMTIDGNITGVYAIVKDVTWRTQLEASLNETAGVLKALIDVAPIAICTLNSEKRITSWNKTAERLFRWSAQELIGEFIPTTLSKGELIDLYDNIVENDQIEGVEVTRKRKDGSLIDVSIWGATLRNHLDEVIGTISIAIDITEQKRMERLLLEAQRRIDDVLQSVNIFLWSFDFDLGKLVFCCGGMEEVCGFTPEELLQDTQKASRLIHADDVHIIREAMVRSRAGETFEIEYRILGKTGEVYWVKSHGTPWRDVSGVVRRLDVVTIDITDRKLSELESQERQQRYESLLNLIPDAVIVHREGVVRYANDATLRMLGLDVTPVGRHVWEFFPPHRRQSLSERFRSAEDYVNNVIPSVKHTLLRSDGTEFPVETASLVIRDEGELSMLTVTRDISHQVQTENDLRFMANHDPLTGLSNRRYFVEQLDHLIKQSSSGLYHDQVAVLFIDMDRFKNVNDSYGHGFGDHALRVMTGRLAECLPVTALLSRFGGDEFAILCPVSNDVEAVDIAQNILRRFDDALLVAEREFFITPSIGIALYPTHGIESETLLKHADVAMYAAKTYGGNRAEFYGQEDEYALEERLDLETEMKKALERGEFVVYYQPKIRLDTGEIYGVEALIRWNHPEHGIIPPGEFIPIAEECGVIVPLGEWVLREVCRQNREWQQKGYTPLFVSVNVSPKQFQVCNMLEVTRNILEETQLDPGWLLLEITEGLLVHNSLEIVSVLKDIRAMGVLVAIDDFGTGYSSLAYLQKFEPSHLKIDRSFVSDMLSDRGSRSIVTAVINLSHNLGMQVVAEGVETEEQLMFLKDAGCDLAQGYLFTKPIDKVAIEMNFLDPRRNGLSLFKTLVPVRANLMD